MATTQPDRQMAERLIQARKLAGFDAAKDAANALGEAESTYGQHENGKRGFSIGKAKRYARFFRVNVNWLVTGRGSPKGPNSFETLYNELEPNYQEQARQYLEFLRSQQTRR